MVCFDENYLHEIPTDIQLNIMNIVKKEKEKELERVEMINENIQNEEYEDVIYILREMTDGYYIESEEEFDDTVVTLIQNCCQEEHDFDNFHTLVKIVNDYGLITAMKLGINNFDMIFEIQNEEESQIYQKCYYAILKEAFHYNYEEYKLIMKYDISTL